MDAKTLRTEIKAWEHAFKKSYNRHPTVDDIKNQPKIAEKYRLYKKLSRQLITTDYTADTNVPSTPPQPSEKHLRLSSALLPKKLAATSSDPPSEVNLFSPKKRALSKVVSENTNGRSPSPPNPFTTPKKKKKGDNNLASFDVQSHFSPTESSHRIQSIPYDPSIDKARKRLRGDPVTPSPKKKRRLIDIYENVEETVYDEDSSFVEESPVKKQAGNKDFTSLFQDAEAPASSSQRTETFAFPSKVEYIASLEDECSSLESKSKLNGGSTIFLRSQRENGVNSQSNESDDVPGDPVQETSLSITTEADPLGRHPILVPPSPPPESGMTTAQRAVMDRKRLKLESKSIEDVEDDQSDGEIEIKEWRRPMQHGESNEEELDSDLFAQQRFNNHYVVSDRSEEAEGSVEIDLPEDLQKILVISPQTHRKDEMALVNHLLYGRRNKSLSGKGAEIYDAGEIDGPEIDSSDEDVWAGEGVPWEVAEL